MTVAETQTLTPQEYLAIERAAKEKSEYYNGYVFARAGASRSHDRATGDVFGLLWTQLRGGACEVFSSDMRVKIEATNTYVYPDVTVACGELSFEDANVDILLNPTLIVEVLSPSTEAHDRGDKFAHYQSIPSLKEYVLVAQDRPRIEHFVRRENGHWDYSEVRGFDAVMPLPSIDCNLPLAEVYARVTFPGAGSGVLSGPFSSPRDSPALTPSPSPNAGRGEPGSRESSPSPVIGRGGRGVRAGHAADH